MIELFKLMHNEGKVIFMANKTNSMAHTKWMCKYHIVFTPKYRRKAIYNQYKVSIRDIIKQLCAYKGVEIIEGHLMLDHIHMLVSIPPKMSVSSFMGYLKGKSALMIFDKHANLKYKYGNRHFWAEGYYVSTVGLNEATIKKYIQEQEKSDIMQDKLSVKECEDPFKGGDADIFLNWLSRQAKAPPVLQRAHVSKGYLYPLFVIPYQIFIQYVNEFLNAYSCPVPVVKHLVFQTAKQPFAGGIVR